MSFAIRLLTLVAFAAHAVLGCCLTHGNCVSWRGNAESGQQLCCDHEDHHGETGTVSVQANNVAENCVEVFGLVPTGTSKQSGVPHQSSCCDHSKCVFGISDSAGPKSDEKPQSNDAVWAELAFGNGLSPGLSTVPFHVQSKIPIPALAARAMLQVWLI
jgi:hypothetical protein